MKRLVSIILVIGIIASLAIVGLVACKDTRTGYPDGEKYSVGPGEYNIANVSKLNVTWTAGAAHITFTDEVTSVQISEENNLTEPDYQLHHYLDPDGTLWIKPLAATVLDDAIPSFSTKILTLKLPKKALAEVAVEQHGAELVLVGANAQKITTYNTGYGTSIRESQAVDLSATSQGITGDVSFNGAVTGTVKISAAMQAFFTTTTMPTEITMSGKGKVSCYIPESNPGFNVKYNSVTAFHSNFTLTDPVDTEDGLKARTFGSGQVAIKLSCSTRTWLFSDKTENITTISYLEA